MHIAFRPARRLSRSQRIAMLGGVADRPLLLRHKRAELLGKLMRLDEAWAELAGQDDPASLAQRCHILRLRGDPASALAAAGLTGQLLAQADTPEERATIRVRQLELLALAGQLDEAVAAAWPLALDTGPAAIPAISLLLRLGLAADRAEALLARHQPLLLAPDTPRGYALYCALLALAQGQAAARSAAGLDRFIHHAPLLAADDPLNAAVIAELRAAQDLHYSAERRPGRHLQRIETLPEWGMEAVPALLERIALAVQHYAQALPAHSDHPFVRRRPAQASITAWAAIAEAQGHEEWHTHDKAWLSGTCYLAMPAGLAGDAGAIVFGWPGCGEARSLVPRAGDLVLFPSYQHHRTVPPGVAGQRIALTFDVMARP